MRLKKNVRLGLAAGGVLCAFGGTAHAGAWDTLGLGSMDLLFAPEAFVVELSTTYADRNVDYDLTTATLGGGPIPGGGAMSSSASPNIWNYQGSVKFGMGDSADCLARVNNPYSVEEKMDAEWAGRFSSYDTQAVTMAIDATCSYKFQVQEGQYFRIIGGARALDLTYKSEALAPIGALGFPVANVDLKSKGMDYNWRLGMAYEIPAYAMRASLIYDSAMDVDLEGTTVVQGGPSGNSFASITLPQSLEFNVQSGIAPRWLASFGVKWVDWSVISELAVTDEVGAKTVVRNLAFKDGWTVKGGIGHQLTDQLALGGSLQWDRGVGGSYSHTYTMGLGGSYAFDEHVKMSLGGAAIYKTSGSGDLSNLASPAQPVTEYDYDGSWNFAVNTKLRVAF